MNQHGRYYLKKALIVLISGSALHSVAGYSQTCADFTSCFELDPITAFGPGPIYSEPNDDIFFQPYDPRDDWGDYEESSGNPPPEEPPGDCLSLMNTTGPLTTSQTESLNARDAAFNAFLAGVIGGFTGLIFGSFNDSAAVLASSVSASIVGFVGSSNYHCGDVINIRETICPGPGTIGMPGPIRSVDSSISHFHHMCVDDIADPPLPPDPPCPGCEPQSPVNIHTYDDFLYQLENNKSTQIIFDKFFNMYYSSSISEQDWK